MIVRVGGLSVASAMPILILRGVCVCVCLLLSLSLRTARPDRVGSGGRSGCGGGVVRTNLLPEFDRHRGGGCVGQSLKVKAFAQCCKTVSSRMRKISFSTIDHGFLVCPCFVSTLLLTMLLLPLPQLYPYECQERLVDVFTTGDEVTVDLSTDTLTNNTTGESSQVKLQRHDLTRSPCVPCLAVCWLFLDAACHTLLWSFRTNSFVDSIRSFFCAPACEREHSHRS